MKKLRQRLSLLLISLQQFWLNMWTKSFHCSLSYSCNSPRGFWQSCETFENSKLNDVLIIWSGAAYGNIIRRSAYWNIIWRSPYGDIIRRSAYCDYLHIEKLYDDLHIAILSADLHIVILSAYWNIILRSGCIEISSANLHICNIYWNIILKSTNWNIISAAHLCSRKMHFSTCNERKEEMWSSFSETPKKIYVELYQFSDIWIVFFQSSLISRVNLKRFKPRRVEKITLTCARMAFATMSDFRPTWWCNSYLGGNITGL